jgi:phenylalanyl-tRNA synthetase alpha chain
MSLSVNFVVILDKLDDVPVLVLTKEGQTVLEKGTPEFRLWSALPSDGSPLPRSKVLATAFDGDDKLLSIATGKSISQKWILLKKDGEKDGKKDPTAEPSFVRKELSAVTDNLKLLLKRVADGELIETADQTTLKARQMITAGTVGVFKIQRGTNWSRTKWKIKPVSELTAEMVQTESWKDLTFKAYNLNSLGLKSDGGHLHPLMKVRTEFREIFLELGYQEMPTNNFVESSFWNFDSLFQPQSHPARDMHDTFFISDPATASSIPEDYMARVKEMHEKGGHGSFGWRYDWQESEARKNLLRTHTTAVSSRMLYQLAQQKTFTPKKYFSIDRVYRNENLDQTHLAEFHQIEGLVADYNLTLTELIGSVKQFFERIGIKNLKFKPAYNPYTEPSMEIFGYHPTLKRWVELGNSGMFRPEMLLPMGLPPDVRVIAWGLSLERPTMIKYSIGNIRQLVGHKVDMDFINSNPLCRL